jgi:hypothetical protein
VLVEVKREPEARFGYVTVTASLTDSRVSDDLWLAGPGVTVETRGGCDIHHVEKTLKVAFAQLEQERARRLR